MPIRRLALLVGGTVLGLGIGLAVTNAGAGLIAGLGAGLVLAAADTLRAPRG